MSKKISSARDLAAGFVGFGHGRPLLPVGATVTAVDMPVLKNKSLPTYRQIKETFAQDLTARDSRFSLSDLVGNQLSVEEEDERRFQMKVAEEVSQQISVVKAEAEANGYASGAERGRNEALDSEKARIAQQLEILVSTISSIEKAKEKLAQQYEKSLLELAFRLAEIIVHREVTERPEIVASTVAAILEKIAKEDDVRVRLPQKSIEAVEKIRAETGTLNRSGRVSLEIDGSLPDGSCVVQSLSGEIASFIDSQFKKLKSEIFRQAATPLAETGT